MGRIQCLKDGTKAATGTRFYRNSQLHQSGGLPVKFSKKWSKLILLISEHVKFLHEVV